MFGVKKMIWKSLLKKGNRIYIIEDQVKDLNLFGKRPDTYTTKFKLGTESTHSSYLEYSKKTGMVVEVAESISSYTNTYRLKRIFNDLSIQRTSQIKALKNNRKTFKNLIIPSYWEYFFK
jgi:hypothetical protein